MDRLTFKAADGNWVISGCKLSRYKEMPLHVGGPAADRMAELENAIEDEALIQLPCRADDLLYWTPSEDDRLEYECNLNECPDIIPVEVDGIMMTSEHIQLFIGGACQDCILHERDQCPVDLVLPSVAIGNELFRTEVEAKMRKDG